MIILCGYNNNFIILDIINVLDGIELCIATDATIDDDTLNNTPTLWNSDMFFYDINYEWNIDFDWTAIRNDQDAINRVVMMARAIPCNLLIAYHRKPFRVNKMMFCFSGHLPKRIRRKRK